MTRALAVLALSGCVAAPLPPAVAPPVVVPPVIAVQPAESMTFPFPFRGVAYRMVIAESQGQTAGRMVLTADQPVAEDLAKTAAANACAFIGRFPVAAMTGVASDGGKAWMFDASCL